MFSLKKTWRKTPSSVRKPLVLLIGLVFVLLAAVTGPLPGPGGIPLFLIGIAILATEFHWAQRVRDEILRLLHQIATWFRRNPNKGAAGIALGIMTGISILFLILI